MNDREVLDEIQRLVETEHKLLREAEGEGMTDADRARLNSIEVHLDQCWDLLRQRRARREFGEDPDEAKVRDASTVEHYQQ